MLTFPCYNFAPERHLNADARLYLDSMRMHRSLPYFSPPITFLLNMFQCTGNDRLTEVFATGLITILLKEIRANSKAISAAFEKFTFPLYTYAPE